MNFNFKEKIKSPKEMSEIFRENVRFAYSVTFLRSLKKKNYGMVKQQYQLPWQTNQQIENLLELLLICKLPQKMYLCQKLPMLCERITRFYKY